MGMIKKVIEKSMFFDAKEEQYNLALSLRKNPTDAERIMWKLLRKFRRSGFPFRRQHLIEFYVADFYCLKLRLVVEVDGGIHSEFFPLSPRERGKGGEAFLYRVNG